MSRGTSRQSSTRPTLAAWGNRVSNAANTAARCADVPHGGHSHRRNSRTCRPNSSNSSEIAATSAALGPATRQRADDPTRRYPDCRSRHRPCVLAHRRSSRRRSRADRTTRPDRPRRTLRGRPAPPAHPPALRARSVATRRVRPRRRGPGPGTGRHHRAAQGSSRAEPRAPTPRSMDSSTAPA